MKINRFELTSKKRIKMNLSDLKIIGISVETTNANGKSAVDIGNLWGKFFSEDVLSKIPNRASDDIFVIYTDYESNYTGKYTTIIGSRVTSLEEIPDGFVGRTFENQEFKKYIAKGKMPDAVVETWQEIWQNDTTLKRTYRYDIEIYGEKSQNGDLSEVLVLLGVEKN